VRETVGGDILRAILGGLVAVFFYSLAGANAPGLLIVFNAFTVVVLYASVRRGEVFGALAGTVCGLAQDAFSLGVFGVGGLTKTLLGFWTGYVSRRIDVVPPARNALFFLIMSVLEMILWVPLSALVRWRPVNLEGGLLFVQPLVTAALATGLFALERWHERRRRRGA
jgi:rod shape-determining protein MreD